MRWVVGFPRSYTVRTGRTDSYRVHVYYRGIETPKGLVPLYPYTIDGVSGEIRGAGCLVIGAGSRHESGELYTVIDDLEPVQTPASLINLIPTERFKDAESDQGKVIENFRDASRIPEGRRWFKLRQLVGRWRNDGADEDALLAMLRSARENICEPGSHEITDLELKGLAKFGAGLPIGKALEPAILTPEGGLIIQANHIPTRMDKIVQVQSFVRSKPSRDSKTVHASDVQHLRVAIRREAVRRARASIGIEVSPPIKGLPKGVRRWTL